ncbi:MAG: hypothetical protein FD143_3227, partial [Ignavibacteria bacterium]
MSNDELIITLPSTSSLKCYPNNKPNNFRVLLPTALELEGLWEVAIVSIQYPYNWANFEEEHVAILVKLQENGGEDHFKSQCRISQACLMKDNNHFMLASYVREYILKSKIEFTGFKMIKMPTGFYESSEEFAQYMAKEFNKMATVPGAQMKPPCKLHATFDPISQGIIFEKENISTFRIATLNKGLHGNIGALPECVNEKLYISDPCPFSMKKAHIKKYNSMYIYCDVIKYQIVGDSQAPLIATMPIHGSRNQKCFWEFNPPYYFPVNKKSITS